MAIASDKQSECIYTGTDIIEDSMGVRLINGGGVKVRSPGIVPMCREPFSLQAGDTRKCREPGTRDAGWMRTH